MKHLFTLFVFVLGACAGSLIDHAASAPKTGIDRPPVVVPIEQAERRRSPNGTATVSILAAGENAFLGRLDMDPGAAVPIHRDPTEEYIFVLSGGGTITIDGRPHPITTGTTVYMPPGVEVHYENGPEPFRAIQVFAGPGPARKYDAWTKLDDAASRPPAG